MSTTKKWNEFDGRLGFDKVDIISSGASIITFHIFISIFAGKFSEGCSILNGEVEWKSDRNVRGGVLKKSSLCGMWGQIVFK